MVSRTDPSHNPLASVEDFERVQATLHLLRALLSRGICGRKIEGRRARTTDRQEACPVGLPRWAKACCIACSSSSRLGSLTAAAT